MLRQRHVDAGRNDREGSLPDRAKASGFSSMPARAGPAAHAPLA